LDSKITNEAFSEFLNDESLNGNQINFIKQIVEYIIRNGVMDMDMFSNHTYDQHSSIVDLFDGKRKLQRG